MRYVTIPATIVLIAISLQACSLCALCGAVKRETGCVVPPPAECYASEPDIPVYVDKEPVKERVAKGHQALAAALQGRDDRGCIQKYVESQCL